MFNLRKFLSASVLLGVIGFPFSLHAKTPDEDFAERCQAPGVLRCVGFDNTTTDIVKNKNLYPDGLGTFRAGLDTNTKASGAGSLVFILPPPPHAGANIAGMWQGAYLTGDPALVQTFSENSTFHVQFRMRFSPEMFTNTWNGNSRWKTVVLHYNGAACAAIELATHNWYTNGIVDTYTHCGSYSPITDPANGLAKTTYTPPYLLQQGDYNCAYGEGYSKTSCFYMVPDEWLTFYYKVHVGTWGQKNSSIEIWVQREGESGYKKITHVLDYTFYCNNSPCSQSPNRNVGFNNLTLTPYMTNLGTKEGLPGVTSKVWYDELIVSTQPIAAPTLNTSPSRPTSVTLPSTPANLTIY